MPQTTARSHSSLAATVVASAAPHALGYPRRSLLLRALVPIALAILLFLTYGPTRSGSSVPRPAELELIR